ncbi:cytochrome P450 [Dendrothele bispora CBS 962.96]|uniref:Cytochrome P450 n=1 Tax=Dendrothele bispora (strain CBS 962.96) TaxID=1314807 RepID=A0A4S8M7G8_DENBC|nr:cytochrome P450 [Dendrothele bispora CBS 962.96]
MVTVGVLWGLSVRKRRKSNLWKLPAPKSTSWLKGHLKELFDPTRAGEFHQMLMEQYGPNVRLGSKMGEHQLYTFDPKVMYHVLVKDAYVFERLGLQGSQLLFGDGITSVTGHHHRKQKKSLNPVFSISHMREMLPVFYEVVNKLQKALIEKVESGPQEVDMLAWMSRTALELIGQSGLGYSFDPLTSDATEHTYSKTIKNLIPALQRLPVLRFFILRLTRNIGTPRFRRFLVDSIPLESLQEVKKMSDYMWGLSEEIYESKKQALAAGDEVVTQQVGRGKDIMSILMRGNMNAGDDRLDEKEVIAQMSTLIFAAMDTTSNALSRILNLLSVHPDVQDKLRKELLEARSTNEELSYDTLVELPYLDAICRETLRLYPPVPSVGRITTRDISIPLSQPIVGLDGSKITELAISKDTPIVLSFINSNRNPDLWGPDALEWKPERWLSPLPQAVIDAHLPGVYSHLMTFSAGTRSCIGFKFSQLEMKAVLSSLISTFKFALVKDKKITWSQSGIATPFVEGDTKHPRMPLIVSIVDQSKESA